MIPASLGGALEFYDFVVFGVFARDIADAVSRSTSPLASLMASFAAFAAGYLARPIGGVLLSHFGDRHGRRAVFLWSLFVMSAATLGMGLVPSFATWGMAASRRMVVLRVVQGLEPGGRAARRPHLRGGNGAGGGSLSFAVSSFRASRWGSPWLRRSACRCAHPPILRWSRLTAGASPSSSVGLGACSAWCCGARCEESPEFARVKQFAVAPAAGRTAQDPRVAVVVGIGLLAGTACFNGLFFSHLPAYLSTVLRYQPREAVLAQTAGVIAAAAGDPRGPAGWRRGCRRAICCVWEWGL